MLFSLPSNGVSKQSIFVRREGLADELMAKGADVVLIDGPNLAADIAKATGNAPIVLALDPVGGDTYSRLAESLGYGGTLVTFGVLSGQPATLNTGSLISNDTRLRGFWLYKWYQTASMQEKQAAFGQVIPLIANGTLKADIDSRFTVDQIQQAVTRARERGTKWQSTHRSSSSVSVEPIQRRLDPLTEHSAVLALVKTLFEAQFQTSCSQ